MVICLGQDANLHMAQVIPLPFNVSCSKKSRLVLPFWYQLTQVVSDKIQRAENGSSSSSSSSSSSTSEHFGENHMTLWFMVEKFWCNKLCEVFLDHPVKYSANYNLSSPVSNLELKTL